MSFNIPQGFAHYPYLTLFTANTATKKYIKIAKILRRYYNNVFEKALQQVTCCGPGGNNSMRGYNVAQHQPTDKNLWPLQPIRIQSTLAFFLCNMDLLTSHTVGGFVGI